jgi:hypothetical protein
LNRLTQLVGVDDAETAFTSVAPQIRLAFLPTGEGFVVPLSAAGCPAAEGI